MNRLLILFLLLPFTDEEPKYVGEFRGLSSGILHEQIKDLTITKNGKYVLKLWGSSIQSNYTIIGRWTFADEEIRIEPSKFIEYKIQKRNYRKSTIKCENSNDEYYCLSEILVYRKDTLFINEKPCYVKK